MDTFAHAVWTFLIYHTTSSWPLAVFFGVMPDLFSWTIYLIYNLAKGNKMGAPELKKIPQWAFTLYGITHSIFVFAAVALLLFILTGTVPIYLWAWLIHIAVDIPTHSRKFLPTPFLWPISEWKFPGFSWGRRWFMLMNWGAIILIAFLIAF